MPAEPPPRPRHPRGLADRPPDVLGPLVLGAWDAFLDLATRVDLDAPSRVDGWTGRDVCVHLGRWPEHGGTAQTVASALAGGSPVPGVVAANDPAFLAAHATATREELIEALHAERADAADYFERRAAQIGRLPAASMLGELPASTIVTAECYELAVHALDLAPCGAPPPPRELTYAGIGALADTTAALAHRLGIEVTMSVSTPEGGWLIAVTRDGWETAEHGPEPATGAAVTGLATTVLDASAGRINPAAAVASGGLRLSGVPTLLRLAPVVDRVPGLPGRSALHVVTGTLATAGRLLETLQGLRPRRDAR